MNFAANFIRFPAVKNFLKIGYDLTKLQTIKRWELF